MRKFAPNSVLPVEVRRLNNGDWIAEVTPTLYGIGRSYEAAMADLNREISFTLGMAIDETIKTFKPLNK